MITNKHLFFLILFTQFGVFITSFPNTLFLKAGHDGWISVLLAGVMIQGLFFVYYSLYKKFPNKSLTDYTKILTNPFIGACLNICYYLYFFYVFYIISMEFADVMNIWMFPNTPSWIVLLLYLITAVIVAKKDIQSIARTYILCSFIFIIFILMLLGSFEDIHIGRILPIGENSVKNISSGIYPSFSQMLGFEIFLFLPPNFQDTKKKLFTFTIVNFTTTILCSFAVFIVFVSFSSAQISQSVDPLLYLFRGYHSKIIDNLDTIFLSLWTVTMTSTLTTYLFIVSDDIHKRLKGLVKKRVSILLIIAFLILISFPLVSMDFIKRDAILKYGSYLDFIFVIIIPCLLFLINKVRGVFN